MPRQKRIEFPGAVYHVMARGDRKEPIVFDNEDRGTFFRTLGEACDRSGILIHAYALLPNHYHLILETPQGNLVAGMQWFQNAYTRRINVKHALWGHLFGGRYKAILIEGSGNYFKHAVDYVHLNPVRAGLVALEDGLETFRWCSLSDYMRPPQQRPAWLTSARTFDACGLSDTPKERAAFLKRLELRIQNEGLEKAGLITNDLSLDQSLQATIQRGWFFGSQNFKQRLLDRLQKDLSDTAYKIESGYAGQQHRDHDYSLAQRLITEGCLEIRVTLEDLKPRKANDPQKVLLAEIVASQTSVSLDWIRTALSMGSRSHCCRLINDQRRLLQSKKGPQKERNRILKRAISND